MKSSLFTAFRLLLTTSSLATFNFVTWPLQPHHLSLTPYYIRAREGNGETLFLCIPQHTTTAFTGPINKDRKAVCHPPHLIYTYL